MKLVSICIPAYQNEAGVRRLLESIEYQTYKDIEVIITDDSIGKEIENLVAEYADRIPLRYIRNVNRKGATVNWNEALSNISSDSAYIKIMHHDDWFTFPDSLERLVKLLEDAPDVVMAFSGTRQVPASGTGVYDRFTPEEDAKQFLGDYIKLYSIGNTIGAPSAVLVRNVEGLPRYDGRLKWLVDMDYYMAILKDHPKFVCTKDPLISIGMSDTQLTNSCKADQDLQIKEYTYVYQKYNLKDEDCQRKLMKVLTENNGDKKLPANLMLDPKIVREVTKSFRKKKWDSILYAIKRRLPWK